MLGWEGKGREGNCVTLDGFISVLVGRGDVLDVGWVVLNDGKVIGRVT